MPQKPQSRISINKLELSKEFRHFERAMKTLIKETEKDAKEVVIAQARLFCVDLVHVTQPWGKGKKAQSLGKGAVGRDINKVYLTETDLYALIKVHSIEQAKAFYYHIKHGDFAEADKIARTVNIDISQFDGGAKHRSSRNSRGRVSPGNTTKLGLKKDVDKYATEVKKRVGFAKSGWADCAGKLGGHRGIPAWIKNQGGDMGKVEKRFNGTSIEVILINKVSYIGKLVDNYHIKKAAGSRARAIERLIKKVVELNAKKNLS
jgi:hypothetical protein